MDIKTVGIDLAKDIITACAIDSHGRIVESRNLRFTALPEWLVQLPAGCVIGMEACSSAHHWGRRMLALGPQPRLITAEFVKPFRKSRRTKNDHNDAEAIAIAVLQPRMRFVAIKSEAQQARLAWHRLREGWKEERTALINRIRGLLLEFGYPLPRNQRAFALGLQVATQHEPLPLPLRQLLIRAQTHLKQLDEQLAACDRTIAQSVRQDCKTACKSDQVGVQTKTWTTGR